MLDLAGVAGLGFQEPVWEAVVWRLRLGLVWRMDGGRYQGAPQLGAWWFPRGSAAVYI